MNTDMFCLFVSRYDFFLVSQSVRQGTVSPTSYNVIYDSTTFKVNHIQSLTYKLTHLYFNWQVRCCSVCLFLCVCERESYLRLDLLQTENTSRQSLTYRNIPLIETFHFQTKGDNLNINSITSSKMYIILIHFKSDK